MPNNPQEQSKTNHHRKGMFRHIERWESSGSSQRAYCEETGIPFSTFSYWRKRYRSDSTQETSGGGFLPLTLPAREASRQVELELPGGVIFRVIY